MTERDILKRFVELEGAETFNVVSSVLVIGGFLAYMVGTRQPTIAVAVFAIWFALCAHRVRPQWRRWKAAKALNGPENDEG